MGAAKQQQQSPFQPSDLKPDPSSSKPELGVGLASQTSLELADKVANLDGPLSSNMDPTNSLNDESRSSRSPSIKKKSVKSTFKIAGPDQNEDINRSVSPAMVDASYLSQLFKIEEWGNIPKVMVDTIEALVN